MKKHDIDFRQVMYVIGRVRDDGATEILCGTGRRKVLRLIGEMGNLSPCLYGTYGLANLAAEQTHGYGRLEVIEVEQIIKEREECTL